MLKEIEALKNELRAEIILLQAHVEFIIDELLEILLESDALRGTSTRLDLKLEILKNLNWLSIDTIHDIKILSKIRGFMAHRIDVYDAQTRQDIENEFKQIKLIKKADPQIFPSGESIQAHIRQVSELYFAALYDIYSKAYDLKTTSSLKNPNSLGENYRFYKNPDGSIVIQYDET